MESHHAAKIILRIIFYPFSFFFILFKSFNKKISYFFYSCCLQVRFANLSLHCRTYPDFVNEKYIHFKGECSFGKRCRVECLSKYGSNNFNPSLELGKNVSFGDDCHIGCINSIVIGENTLIGSKVLITDHSHGKSFEYINSEHNPSSFPLYSKGKVIIGHDCWIGENVAILPNSSIGNNCIIGANAVVTKKFSR